MSRSFTQLVVGFYALLIVVAFGGMLLYVGHALSMVAWHEHPNVVRGLGLGLAAGALVLLSLQMLLRDDGDGDSDEDHDGESGGGGGERRRPPAPPTPPSPAGGLEPDWDSFDEVRREWEHTSVPVAA